MHIAEVAIDGRRFPTREHYPFCLDQVQQTKSIAFTGPITLFVGENGTGKSTFVKALCTKCGIAMWEGPYQTPFRYNPYENKLHECLDIRWADGPVAGAYFGSQTFQYFAKCLDEWASTDPGMLEYFGGKSLVTQSHGQGLISYFESRYKRRGLYLLDEPETALSPSSQLHFLDILTQASHEGHAQFIIATHSPILLACPEAAIYSFDAVPVSPITYEETTHYQVYRDFLLNREPYLAPLDMA